MAEREIAAIVLAAGEATRMKSDTPKVLHPIAGRPMIGHVLDALAALPADRVIVVVGPGMDDVVEAVAPAETVLQEAPLGTGHAVLSAREALAGFTGDVLVLFGADPLITPKTLRAMVAARRTAPEPAIVALGMRPADPALYGRLIVSADGLLENIVEARDATAGEQAVTLCNAGAMAVDGALLFGLLDRVGNDNAKGEYYLTDIVAIARADGLRCAVVEGAADELIGIDSHAGLAAAEALVQDRLRAKAMAGGVTLLDPPTVTLSYDTAFGRDVVVEPHVVFGAGVRVGNGVRIRAFSHLEGATLADGAAVGPFARLRPGAEVGVDARVGNFVEVKNAVIEAGAKVNHLTYIGDARVGAGANVGAGTITCNYDGFTKSHTDIGAGAFIGSNTALVAPVKVGDGAVVGAGSVITGDVAADALALTRAPQTTRAGWAARLRAAKGKRGKG
ncbi:MAG: bifunctional UDP-N-acetylglucosamine diphosphorylase/glucosamine-1-phosphate N-acetyltransferase GlmU [Proteobacteria bacterium]|nr:bifunctional UDP-N-acetylglucosamine diphosphorylase/glucosamine-1-phosphate N-acetyltransferase GlmU [Pseudomonadota bacterium]